MDTRIININKNDLSIKPKKERNTKKAHLEPVTINTTNIRKLLLEKLKQHKKTQKNILLNKDNFDSKVPNYSNLKNGSKPTYRELQKLNISQVPVQIMSQPVASQQFMSQPVPAQPVMSQQFMSQPVASFQPIQPVVQSFMSQPVAPQIDIFNIPSNKPYIQEREIKKTFRLGKNPKNNSINVLIKCNKTRKNVEHMKSELKKTKINTIKNYLKTNNLIKFGTSAPSGLLKEIYESSKLCGEVYNNNANTLIHNYNINNNS